MERDSNALAAIHRLHDKPVALHQRARLSLFLQHDTLADKRQYGVVRLQKGRATWIGGTYRKGWIDAEIRELGDIMRGFDSEGMTDRELSIARCSFWLGHCIKELEVQRNRKLFRGKDKDEKQRKVRSK